MLCSMRPVVRWSMGRKYSIHYVLGAAAEHAAIQWWCWGKRMVPGKEGGQRHEATLSCNIPVHSMYLDCTITKDCAAIGKSASVRQYAVMTQQDIC